MGQESGYGLAGSSGLRSHKAVIRMLARVGGGHLGSQLGEDQTHMAGIHAFETLHARLICLVRQGKSKKGF